ncbi:MAG: hypothetical protein J0H87_02805 [Holosporales bacterium]|mgnify:CR=1 FL=1|nr:hypothetical protein [Holosporales bacterium]
MQSENRLFDDAAKMMCKIVRSFCKLKKMLCKTEQSQSHSFQEMDTSKAKKKSK